MVAKRPGKEVRVYQGQVVILADNAADYDEKVPQWFFANPPT